MVKKSIASLSILLFCFWYTTSISHVFANSYYVSPNGSDANSGTLISPLKTISRCLNMLSAGDTCHLRAGTYHETITLSKKGTPTNPITLTTYNNEKAIIDGERSRPTFNLPSSEHIVISNLTLSNSSSYALYSDGSKNIKISNVEVDHPLDGGLIFRNGQNILIENSDIHHTNFRGDGSHEAISMVNTSDFEIKGNHVHDSLEEGIDAKYGSSNGKIHHNEVYGNGGPNIYIDAASNIKIFNNQVSNAKGDKANIGLAVEYHQNQYITENIDIYNNILRNSPGGVSFWIESTADSYARFSNIYIAHNLFYDNQARGAFRLGAAAGSSSGITLINNIFWKNTSNIDTTTQLNASYNLFDNSPKGSNSITVSDAHFVDETNLDFHLQPSSAAINAGGSTPSVIFDYADNPRPISLPDIGPYEYSSNSPLPSIMVAGDLNNDQHVNFVDFNQLISAFGNPYTILDFNNIISNYGK